MNKLWIYDVETMINMFEVTFLSYDTDEYYTFIIDENNNDRNKIIKFVKDKMLIGYNNKTFDKNTHYTLHVVSTYGCITIIQIA